MADMYWLRYGWPIVAGVFLCWVAGCDCAETLEIPRGQELPPLEFELALADGAERPIPGGPERVRGHFYLRVDQDGAVSGVMSAASEEVIAADLQGVTGRVEGREIVLEPGRARVEASGELAWDEMRLGLGDADCDGRADRARGSATGTWTGVDGDAAEAVLYSAVLSAHSFDIGPIVAATPDIATVLNLRPYQELPIRSREPLRDSSLRRLRVLADGAAVAGTLASNPIDGLSTAATFQPDDFLPFDSDITLMVDGLTDPSGNPASDNSPYMATISDPGRLLDNPGFEDGITGWHLLGEAQTGAVFESIAPVEGQWQVIVGARSTLSGYLDVPEDASTFDFSIAVLSAVEDMTPEYTAVVAIHAAGQAPVIVFDSRDEAGGPVPCEECTMGFAYRMEPRRVPVDLVPYRGQRLWLSVETRSSALMGELRALSVLLDDLRVALAD